MRTITKIRLPAYGFIAIVLLASLSGRFWVLPVGGLIIVMCSAWLWPRCPRCGEAAGYVTPKRFWRRYVSYRGICARCGADFFKV